MGKYTFHGMKDFQGPPITELKKLKQTLFSILHTLNISVECEPLRSMQTEATNQSCREIRLNLAHPA